MSSHANPFLEEANSYLHINSSSIHSSYVHRQRSILELTRLAAAVTEVDAQDQAPGLLHACALGEKSRGCCCFHLCLLDVHTVQVSINPYQIQIAGRVHVGLVYVSSIKLIFVGLPLQRLNSLVRLKS